MFDLKVDELTKYVALASGFLYAAGFLVVNANLASYGDFDPDFASARYIFAGFLFVWFMMPFVLCVIRPVYSLKEINDKLDILRPLERHTYYFTKFQLYVLSPVNFICICASVFGVVTLSDIQPLNYKNYLSIIILVLTTLVIKKLKTLSSENALLFNAVMSFISINLFLGLADGMIKRVAFDYTLAYIVLSFTFDSIRKGTQSLEGKYNVAYGMISSITIILLFGDQLYGHVKHQFGGGLPVSVTIYTKSDVGTSELTKSASGGYLVDMIALNDKKLIGISAGKLTVINADNITAVIYP